MKKKSLLLLCASLTAAVTATVIGLTSKGSSTTFGGSNDVWSHYKGVAATCTSRGVKEYWVNCATHEHQFEAPATYTSIEEKGVASDAFIAGLDINDDRLLVKKHNFGTLGPCENCGAISYMKTDNFWSNSLVSHTETGAPAGYNEVWTVKMTNTNGAGLLKDLSVAPYTYINFKLKLVAGREFGLQPTADYAYYKYDPVTEDEWVEVTAELKADSKWVITSSKEMVKHGTSNYLTTFEKTVTSNSIQKFLGLRANDTDNFEISEIVLSNHASKHVHNFDETTKVCSTCGYKKVVYDDTRLQNPENLTTSTVPCLNGTDYAEMYLYNGTTGGGTAGGFFKHTNVTGLNSTISEIKMLIFATSGVNLRVRNATGGGQTSVGVLGYVELKLVKGSDGWSVYANGTKLSCVLPVSNSPFGMGQLLCDAAFNISETLYK